MVVPPRILMNIGARPNWNDGMMESWIMGKWIVVLLARRRRIDRKNKNRIPSFYNPTFQYSNIPLFHD